MWTEGVKNVIFFVDVINGWPLTSHGTFLELNNASHCYLGIELDPSVFVLLSFIFLGFLLCLLLFVYSLLQRQIFPVNESMATEILDEYFTLKHHIISTQARAFSVVGPSVWNRLPLSQRLLPRILSDTFYSTLKTLLFSRARVGSASE